MIFDATGGEWKLLLIRRAHRIGDPWSGHIGLPGGRASPTDPTLLVTAQRETEEEVGLRLSANGRLIGQLDDVPAVARGRQVPLIITPFVFSLNTLPVLVPDSHEVQDVLWAPVAELNSPEHRCEHVVELGSHPTVMPGVRLGAHVIWGLTLKMLLDVFSYLDDSFVACP